MGSQHTPVHEKYVKMHFVLYATSNVYYIQEQDMMFRRRYGWVVYAQYDVLEV